MEDDRPIFIIGSVRSGTSIVKQALTQGAGIPGFLEGCFIDFLGTFLRIISFNYGRRQRHAQNQNIMLGHVPQEALTNDLLAWFKQQYHTYSPYRGQWVDKTADREVLHAVPYIRRMWPRAVFIFMQRRSIENVMSRIRKFPHVSRTEHMRLWTELLTLQERARQQLPSDSYIVIDQYDVATKPREVAERLGVFLHLTHEQIASLEQVFTVERPEHTGGNERVVASLDTLPWTDAEKQYFTETCAPLTESMGWSLNHTYYR